MPIMDILDLYQLIIILMQQPRNKQSLSKKKPDLLQNPQLTTAQLTLGKTGHNKNVNTPPTINPIEVLEQASQLWEQNDSLESINLLKGLIQYLKNTKYGDQQIVSIIHINLAVSYYKIGFLQQANDQFNEALSVLKDLGLTLKGQINKLISNISKSIQKIKYDMVTTKIQLQICILFSQMGKHDQALQHARISVKHSYNIIYDLQVLQYQHIISLLNKSKSAYAPNHDHEIALEGYQDLVNNIIILDHLINVTKDLRKQFIVREKQQLLDDHRLSLAKIGKLSSKSNLDLLYSIAPQNAASLWVYKNKILDQIQIKFIKEEIFQTKNFWNNHQIIQKIVYLIISLYCYSTQTRFIEKNKENDDPSQVLDSQHWLSRSLELAYIFLPHEAPILNQILTVHDRFHGIDKQTIPEDRQVGGFFKVLRPLSKPKSNYSNKSALCSPIMIRIQMPKMEAQLGQGPLNEEADNHLDNSSKMAIKNIDFANKTIDIDTLTKNNKIRGLNGPKKYQLTEISQSTIKHKQNTKIDFTENLKNIYASRKIKSVAQHIKPQRMKINLTGLITSEQTEGVKSMRRPHSYDRQIEKQEQTNVVQTERKKKSFSLKREERKKRSVTSNSTGLKLDGLQMLPNPFKKGEDDDSFEFNNLSGKLTNVEATKIGGNIFINNNINLFISKQSLEENQLNTKRKDDKTMYEVSRRQNFINKRKAFNSNLAGTKNPDFII